MPPSGSTATLGLAYGYNDWRADLTPQLGPGGINQLAIRLDNPMESARWYSGGGISAMSS
jgi:beta-galactosidase